jgi:hypothetical protein
MSGREIPEEGGPNENTNALPFGGIGKLPRRLRVGRAGGGGGEHRPRRGLAARPARYGSRAPCVHERTPADYGGCLITQMPGAGGWA